MSSKTKEQKSAKTKKSRPAGTQLDLPPTGEPAVVRVDLIDIHKNYRRYYSMEALNVFAKVLKKHGIISPPTVRKMPSGRYQLLVGQRRLRGSQIAGLVEIPVVIREMTDEEALEFQLQENLQREDPHPLHEAQGILQMQQARKPLKEIAMRLGKSETFVYSRLRLADLVEDFHEMFLADRLTIQEALEIATLSPESQKELYSDHCADWQEQEDFGFYEIQQALSRYKFDLRNTSFDIDDKTLVPEMGACSGCAFNSATFNTLFPEDDGWAVCTNRECFMKKCKLHLVTQITAAFAEQVPEALVFNGTASTDIQLALNEIPEAGGLPHFSRYDITILAPPEKPLEEDYIIDDEDGEFDKEGYEDAMEDYRTELDLYDMAALEEKAMQGLTIGPNGVARITFLPAVQQTPAFTTHSTGVKTTAKQVQEAIKNKTATPEMLRGEIVRINERESRSKELDREKVQLSVHKAFEGKIVPVANNQKTPADELAARLLIYQSLDYSSRGEVDEALFNHEGLYGADSQEDFLETLAALTEDQYCYMIRKALTGKSESKLPGHTTGKCLYKLAESAGVDVAWIEKLQEEKAEGRAEKAEIRISQLNRQIKRLATSSENQELSN